MSGHVFRGPVLYPLEIITDGVSNTYQNTTWRYKLWHKRLNKSIDIGLLFVNNFFVDVYDLNLKVNLKIS